MRTPAASLGDAASRLTRAESLDEIADILRATARRLVGSDGITLVLREGDDCHYVEEDAVSPLWKGGRFPMASCISGWAMTHRATAVIPDILKDRRIPQELYRRTFVRSLVMAPIGRDSPRGALGAYWAQTDQPTAEEVETVETLAAAAAVALERLGAEQDDLDEHSAIPRAGLARLARGVRVSWRERCLRLIPKRELGFWPGQLLALSSVAFSMLVRGALTPLIGPTSLFTSFFPAVLLTALWGGPKAAVTAVLASVAAGAYLDLQVNGASNLPPRMATWLLFAIVAASVAALAVLARMSLEEQRRHTAMLEERDAQLAMISRELDHRIRNTFAIITALVMQSARTSATPAEMSEKLSARLHALGEAQALVVQGGAWGLTLRELVETALAAFGRDGEIRIEIPEDIVAPRGSEVSLMLALHELATNAVKHGALARREGSVCVRSTQVRDRRHLTWEESGVRNLRPSERRGSGSRLIERAACSAPQGRVDVRFEPTGLVCEISWQAHPRGAPTPAGS